jgi:hypothetical protein
VSHVSGEGALGTSDGDNTSLHVNSDYINETKAQQMSNNTFIRIQPKRNSPPAGISTFLVEKIVLIFYFVFE